MPGVPRASGPVGAAGPAGLADPPGRAGEPGPFGLRGSPGEIGMKGEKGIQGVGQKGNSGVRGKGGPKGEKGVQGDRGLQGSSGLIPMKDIEELKQLVGNLTESVLISQNSIHQQVVSLNNTLESVKLQVAVGWKVFKKSKTLQLPRGNRVETTFDIS
ncbi:pulmonary surfactant-associated protein D-like, partial [Corticium candelabrum]|uniref:pulmonary surfactant-associated protein D-like n=1 Tax=Corticium candelabrum TaxID=121492 RepID=UPI002E2724B7